MDAHVDSLFFGKRLTTPEDINKRLWLRVGLSPSQTKLNDRMNAENVVKITGTGGDGTDRKGVTPSCLSIAETSKAFGRYFDGKESLLRTLHSINTLIQKPKPLLPGGKR